MPELINLIMYTSNLRDIDKFIDNDHNKLKKIHLETNLIDLAANHNQLPVIQYLHRKFNINDTSNTLNLALYEKHPQIVEYLQNRLK